MFLSLPVAVFWSHLSVAREPINRYTPCQYSVIEESVLGQLSGGLNAVSCL